jgi:hypothetical protein
MRQALTSLIVLGVTALVPVLRADPGSSCSEPQHELPQIDDSLNGLAHDDPVLIEALRERFLIAPARTKKGKKAKISLKRPISSATLKGQYGQPFAVDDILKYGLALLDESLSLD